MFIPCVAANNVDVSAIILPPEEEEVISKHGGTILFKDIISPANVSFFIAKPGNEEIVLSWLNPENLDFAFVQIERKQDFFSLTPGQGFLIYKGKDQFFLDKNLINGKTYYYTIWAYDTAGNFSSGAIAFAIPQKILSPETAPLNIIPLKRILSPEIAPKLPPASAVPAIPIISEILTVLKINLEDFSLFINSIEVKPKQAKIQVLPNSLLTFFISADKFKQGAETIQIVFDNQIFLLSLDKQAKFYNGAIKAPEKPGEYSLDIYTILKDRNYNIIKVKVLVENFGQTSNLINKKLNKFYEKLNLKDKVEGIQATLYWFNQKSNQWEIWPGLDYNQKNPQITNEKAEYGFMVPSGKYYLFFSKKGYLSKTIKEFEPENNIINFNIDLVPWRPLIVVMVLCVLIIIWIIRFLIAYLKNN
ncbi:hypothetical protein KJ627_03855 [Patescibacteria group bacterium]|nr:hypothetical protein [Patescibacteria group bacterium]MBU1934150.1 hypothetical protein [Patescibacteria group bacterium]MBU2007534.1 hypothetical protein [Patescibacteria group bacterium]MBU2233965.1 hypothetical protein [Patescibacteria group bacterium]MBU2264433.1 hypothetical protein [Patescibacteria group bacterium]